MPGPDPVASSAPGKVLLTGGYLVLEQQYPGVVYSLDARIHAIVRPLPLLAPVPPSPSALPSRPATIVARSLDFKQATWRYSAAAARDGHGAVHHVAVTWLPPSTTTTTTTSSPSDDCPSPNKFVQTALAYTLSLLAQLEHEHGGRPAAPIPDAEILIAADSAYYSADALVPGATSFADAPKTGLGSSAALTAALICSLLRFFGGALLGRLGLLAPPEHSSPSSVDMPHPTLLHNLAQAVHCAAQGKIGSGFDIAAAVYGSCEYRRFSPSLLADAPPHEPAGAAEPAADGPSLSRWLAQLLLCAPAAAAAGPAPREWDVSVRPDRARLPPGIGLLLCDVRGGSKTPAMVRQVLAWRARDRAVSDPAWAGLAASNGAVQAALAAEPFSAAAAAAAIADVVARLAAVSAATGVPVVPAGWEQTLPALAGLDGVVGGLIPGAGGHDAVALLVEERPAGAYDGVLRERGMYPLPTRHDSKGGVVPEGLDQYEGRI